MNVFLRELQKLIGFVVGRRRFLDIDEREAGVEDIGI